LASFFCEKGVEKAKRDLTPTFRKGFGKKPAGARRPCDGQHKMFNEGGRKKKAISGGHMRRERGVNGGVKI